MSKTIARSALVKAALRPAVIAVAMAGIFFGAVQPALGAGTGTGHEIKRRHWSFAGLFGAYNPAQLQRGYQVFSEHCASCHGVKRIYFRNLAEPGGPEFPLDRVKALAQTFEVDDGPNDDGEMFKRKARLSDNFTSPFPNDNAARAANNGAFPPDLSLITRARTSHTPAPFYLMPFYFLADAARGHQEGGADYIYALLTGYQPAPAYKRGAQGRLIPDPAAEARDKFGDLKPGFLACVSVKKAKAGKGAKPKPDVCNKLAEGMYYNTAFPGMQIAMPPPLASDFFLTYQDGSGSLAQNAEDLTAFLAWTADPKLEQRKSMGFTVMIYLFIMTVMLYLAKRRIWARVAH